MWGCYSHGKTILKQYFIDLLTEQQEDLINSGHAEGIYSADISDIMWVVHSVVINRTYVLEARISSKHMKKKNCRI